MRLTAVIVGIWLFIAGYIAALVFMQHQTDVTTRDTFRLNLPDGETYNCYALGSDVRCDYWDN